MESENKRIKIIAGACTILFVLSLLYLGREMRANSRLEEGLNNELLKSETMLSEKLALEKEIAHYKSSIQTLTSRNRELDNVLTEERKKLDAKDQEAKKLARQNAALSQYKVKHDALEGMRKELEKQVALYEAALKQLRGDNEQLARSVATLEKQNQDLTRELNQSRLASINDVRIESVKGKRDKLTVSAKRTKVLKVNVNVPAASDNISFRIVDPGGKELTSKDGVITARERGNSQSLTASTKSTPLTFKQMEMAYVPKGKLIPGVYTIMIQEGDNLISRLQVRLR